MLPLLILLLTSCGQLRKTPALVGEWNSETFDVTVRTKDSLGWNFTNDSCSLSLHIDNNFNADGEIGMTQFNGGNLKTIWLLPVKMTGAAYLIKYDSIGKLFASDPVDDKSVQFTLGPIRKDTISVTVFEKKAKFPMGQTNLFRVK